MKTQPSQTDPAPTDSVAAKKRNVLETAKGTGVLAGGSLFEFVSRFVIAYFLARILAAEGYGSYNLATSAAALFSGIGALGLDDAMVRYVAIQSSQGDRKGIVGTLQVGAVVGTIGGIVMGAILYLAAEPVSVGLFDEASLAPMLQIVALVIPFLTLSNVLAGAARGFKRMDYSAFAENVVQSVIRMVLVVALSFSGFGPVTAVVIFGISDIAATLTLLRLLRSEVRYSEMRWRSGRREYRPLFRFALPLWLSGTLVQFRKNLETVILGALGTIADVGIFTIASRVNMIGHVVYRSIVTSVKPVLAQLHAAGDRDGLQHMYVTATRWMVSFNLPFFAVMTLYSEELLSIFGSTFAAGATALVLLAAAELVNSATGICGSIIDMAGHTRVKMANSIVWFGVVIGTDFWLIPAYGLIGAAAASLISTAFINILRVVEVAILDRVHPYDWSQLKPAFAGALAVGLGFALRSSWAPDSVIVAGTQMAIIVTIYAGALILMGIAPEDRVVVSKVVDKTLGVVRGGKKRGRHL